MRFLACLFLAAVAYSGEVTLTVLHTNDLHGQLTPLPPSPVRSVLRGKPAGGFAHFGTMVDNRRANVLLLDGGDIFQGTPIGNVPKGRSVVEAMNVLRYDAIALGNHEFDYGIENLMNLVEQAKFPILAANVTGLPLKPYVVFAPPRMPCRVAVIGLITPNTPQVTTPGVTKGLKFADPVPVVRNLLKEIEADVFIVVCHLGRDEERRLAREVPQLALIAGGHSHTPYVQRIGKTQLMQTSGRGASYARADLRFDTDGWKLLDSTARLVPVDPQATEPHAGVQAVIDKYGKELEEKLKRPVGTLKAPLRRKRGLHSSSAGNWMSDVIRAHGKADVGFMNKGGIRTDLEAGEVTAGDIYRLMPFDNTLISMDLTGAQLRTILQRHFQADRFPGLEWSGLAVDIDSNGTVLAVTVGEAPLDAEKSYRVATNSFIGAGGDGFMTFRDGRRRERGRLLREILADAMTAQSPVTPPTEQRLRVVEPAR